MHRPKRNVLLSQDGRDGERSNHPKGDNGRLRNLQRSHLSPYHRIWDTGVTAWIISLLFLSGLRAATGWGSSPYAPLSNSVYEFLEHCSARGIIPLEAITERPLTRREVAELLIRIAREKSELRDRILVRELEYQVGEFLYDIDRNPGEGIELPERGKKGNAKDNDPLERPHRHLSVVDAEEFQFVFDPVITFRLDAGERESVFRRATGIQFRGYVQQWMGYYFRFVDHVERGAGEYRSRTQLLEDRYGYVGPLHGGAETYYDLTEAYISFRRGIVEFAFGKDDIRWGASLTEPLLLSGNAPSINHFRFSIQPIKNVRFTHVLGRLNAWNVAGDTLYKTGEGRTRIVPANKWIAAHRLEYGPWDWVRLSVSEAVVWGERGLDPAYINPINFYYSAEHDGSDQDNVLLSGDATVRFVDMCIAYGSLLIDDLKISGIGRGDPTTKLGIIIGMWISRLGIDGLDFGLEYVRLNPFVYSHFYPVNRYTSWTSSLGSSLRPNSDMLRIEVNYRPVRSLLLHVRGGSYRHGTTGGEITQPLPRNRSNDTWFLDGDRTDWTEVAVSAEWELKTGLFIEAGGILGAERSWIPDRVFLGWNYRY